MIQLILFIVAIIAFAKGSISVTKESEIIRPNTHILGGYALFLVLAVEKLPDLLFYLLLFFFFILAGKLSQAKKPVIKQ